MKKYVSLVFYILILHTTFSCSKKNNLDLLNKQIDEKTQEVVTNANTICGSANPEQSLLWLKGIIQKAEEDRLTKKYMGNYMGKITSTSYRNEPVFYIRMALGSGGIYAYIYDCNGKTVYINPDDMLIFEQNAQQGKLIYSNS